MHIWNASIYKIVQYWEDYKSAEGFTLITKISVFFSQKSATLVGPRQLKSVNFTCKAAVWKITCLTVGSRNCYQRVFSGKVRDCSEQAFAGLKLAILA